jgi:hypothetical protein
MEGGTKAITSEQFISMVPETVKGIPPEGSITNEYLNSEGDPPINLTVSVGIIIVLQAILVLGVGHPDTIIPGKLEVVSKKVNLVIGQDGEVHVQ